MHGELVRGAFVTLACRLGWGRRTGELVIVDDGGSRHELYLRDGYLVSARVSGCDATLGTILVRRGVLGERTLERMLGQGENLGRALVRDRLVPPSIVDDALREQAALRLSHLATLEASFSFDEGASPPPSRSRSRPVSILDWARGYLVALSPAAPTPCPLRVTVERRPDETLLDVTERRVLRALPCPSIDALARATRLSRGEVERALRFLYAAGVLDREPTPPPPPVRLATPEPIEHDRARALELLGLEGDASLAAIRRAFRALARATHPDHAQALPPDEQRRRAARFMAATAAYRVLAASARTPA